ncbi:quaternary ammonium compound efflux SMR transporter SugE [Luteimonas huabeiensis]|uniref:quaternary ammonium compound efflux SMR transporter SugE n=1 Tax=Luteimonas huabeiensis TaxID=1244513 RepID=UPI000465CBCC|nr:quaternary ammonium compound efflux SMR transporter SugE [Luteimonas huabeiensis]
MHWIVLLFAGLFEVVWAVGLKYTEGFTRLWPTLGTFAAMAVSFYLLSRAMTALPLGTAYAVWVGIGAVGTALVGMAVLGEPAGAGRLISIGLIVAGVIGLKLASG